MSENESKFNIETDGRSCGYDKMDGWALETSERTQRTYESEHIPGRYQWEETVGVSKEDDCENN